MSVQEENPNEQNGSVETDQAAPDLKTTPPPSNNEGITSDETQKTNDDQTENGHSNELIESTKYVEGLIYPPPEIRSIVDKTAAFVAKNSNPKLFEDKIRQRERTDARFSFLNADDAYNAYYRHRIECVKNGEVSQPSGNSKDAISAPTGGNSTKAEEEDKPPEPSPLEFLIEPNQMPKINASDLEIIKLTAMFTARSGRKLISDLAQREARNYQFDFLRPSHSLFGFFNRLVDQYTKIFIPPPESLKRLEKLAGGKAIDRKRLDGETLAKAQKEHFIEGKREVMIEAEMRVNWERYQGLQLQKKTSEEEKEKKEFNEIDWEDFIVVSTVEFTENDEVIDLPPPMSISEVENMTIAQKKMAAMVMEGKDVTGMTEEELALEEQANEQEANEMLESAKRSAEEARAKAVQEAELEEPEGVDDDPKIENKQVAEIKKLNTTGMKIRKDYVPKNKQLQKAAQSGTIGGKVITTLCQICGQQINVNEISEHVRIELLDPRWKEKKQKTELNRSSSNMLTLGSDVSSSLRDLAKSRLDIFEENVTEEEKQRREAEQKKLKQLAKDKYTWDGHINTGERITNIYQSGANLDEQIQALHRSKGLTGDSIHSGPQIGPLAGAMPPQPPPSQTTAALIQKHQQLQLQQQQIDLHIQKITSGIAAAESLMQKPSFAGGATLSAAPQPSASRPPTIDPGRAAMISQGSIQPPGAVPQQAGLPLPGLNPPPGGITPTGVAPPPGHPQPPGIIPHHSGLTPTVLAPPGGASPSGAVSLPGSLPPPTGGATPQGFGGLSPQPGAPASLTDKAPPGSLPTPISNGSGTPGAPTISTPNHPTASGLPGRPNVPDFGAGIPGPSSQTPPIPPASSSGTPIDPSQLTPLTAQQAIDSITNQPPPSTVSLATRPAEDDHLEGQPGLKKQKIVGLEGTKPSASPVPVPNPVPQLFTEEQWIEIHPEPIKLVIQLPVYNDKPEWGCDGSQIVLEENPITLLVGVLRDKLLHLKGIPVGRQQLKIGSKILPNQVTLASLNLKAGDVITLGIKEQRKK